MAFGGLILTNNGRRMLDNAQTGTRMTITKVQLGDGQYSGSYSDVSALVSPVLTIDDPSKIKVTRANNGVLVEVRIDNSGWTSGMYFREIGIFASDGAKEVVYEYDNSGVDRELIPAGDGAVNLGYRMRFMLTVSADANVTISTTDAFSVTREELEAALDEIDLTITDVTTKKKYEWGMDNGAVYLMEV